MAVCALWRTAGTPTVSTLEVPRMSKFPLALPLVAAYLRSERRLPFNEQGIFRRYPELDVDPG